ncbi:hypothetical protein BIW11_14062 [Tropilaelaps mercedesae]|uniref:Uncharacterized protein n=1 Tax=Tropilaelaps mercedesae TaxID=418985 RepID=A0A1V9WZQ2_9ACAR|nr:hypothetical protein BIW11_14062 [Tropilaelaps mercedesae]
MFARRRPQVGVALTSGWIRACSVRASTGEKNLREIMRLWQVLLLGVVLLVADADAGRKSGGGGGRRRAQKAPKSKGQSSDGGVGSLNAAVPAHGVPQGSTTTASVGASAATKTRRRCRQDQEGNCVARRRGGQKAQRPAGASNVGAIADSSGRRKIERKRAGRRRQKSGSAVSLGTRPKQRKPKMSTPAVNKPPKSNDGASPAASADAGMQQ